MHFYGGKVKEGLQIKYISKVQEFKYTLLD